MDYKKGKIIEDILYNLNKMSGVYNCEKRIENIDTIYDTVEDVIIKLEKLLR